MWRIPTPRPAPPLSGRGVLIRLRSQRKEKSKVMPCPNKKPVRSYLTADEHERLNQMAQKAGISVSRFMRDASLGYQFRSFEHEEFKLELLKTRADLGRLGGLLKMALSVPDGFSTGEQAQLRALLIQITQRQNELKAVVERL